MTNQHLFDDGEDNIHTTGGAGFVPSVSQSFVNNTVSNLKSVFSNFTLNPDIQRYRFYKHFDPYSAYDKASINRAINLLLGGPNYAKSQYLKDREKEGISSKYAKASYIEGAVSSFDDAVWGSYLGIPKNNRRFKSSLVKSKYSPTKGNNDNTYYTIPIKKETKDQLVREANNLNIGDNKNTQALFGYNMGTSTLGKGYDDKGEYISYYDKWDINPLYGAFSSNNLKKEHPIIYKLLPKDGSDAFRGFTNPLNFYDRIYLDDYYGLKEPSHATYLPEVTVMPNVFNTYANGGSLDIPKHWDELSITDKNDIMATAIKNGITNLQDIIDKWNEFAEGGSIHIAKNKRGTFKAQASRMGMSTQQAASHILANKDDYSPAMVKKAVFAHNFAHAYGGKMYDDGGVTSSNGQYHVNPTDYLDVLSNVENNKPVEVTLPDVTVKAADPKNYRSSYDPNGFMDFMNAVTLGVGNRFSVSQDARLLKDAYDAATGNKSWKDVFNSAVLGNEGIFGNPYDKYSFMDKLKMSMMNKIPLIPDPTTFNAPFDNVTGNVNDRTSSVAQVSYLLPRDKQQKLFEDYGYKRVYNDYGTVKRAAESKGYPIYQKNSDDASRENLVPIGNADSDPFEVETTYKGKLMEVPTNWYAAPNKSLIEAGATRSTIYYNPNNGKYYQKAWDLNDYGGNGGSTADIFGKFLDTIGNPVVVTSGIQEVLPENINKVEKNYILPYAKKHYLKKADNGHWEYVAPDVIIYGHKHVEGGFGDGGPLESDEDSLLAPIIKYYEDSNPYLSIEDQNTFAKGGQMKKARQAVDYFVNKGLTREQAAGLVGNLMRESGMNIAATNPNSGAYGLGQWLGNRKTRLFRRYGYHPTFEQQLDYVWDELNTSHRRGLQMLRASKTVNDAARNAFGYYEFSAGPEAAVRAMNGSGKNTKWKNPNGTYALNSGIKNAQMIFGEVPMTMNNVGDTLTLDTPESTPNIQPIISNDYAPVTTANLKELPTFGQEEDNDSSIPSYGPQYLAQNLDRLGMTNPLNPFEKGYQLQSPKAIYANMQGLI